MQVIATVVPPRASGGTVDRTDGWPVYEEMRIGDGVINSRCPSYGRG
jgi:hypothetical protein